MSARLNLASSVFPIISLQILPFHGVTNYFAPRRSAIRRVIKGFRTLSVLTEGVPLTFLAATRTSSAAFFVVLALDIFLRSLLWAGKVGLAVANLIFASHFDLDFPVSVCGTSRCGVVPQAVLRTQLTVDAIENAVQFACGVGEEHSATHGIGNRLQGVLPGRVAATLVFDWATDDGVEERA